MLIENWCDSTYQAQIALDVKKASLFELWAVYKEQVVQPQVECMLNDIAQDLASAWPLPLIPELRALLSYTIL